MSRALVLVSAFLLSCAIGRAVGLDELYEQRAQLVKERNVEALLAQTTPDYAIRLRDGTTMSRADIRDRWRFYYDKVLVRHIRFSNEIRSIRYRGDEAMVTFEQKDHRIQNGPDGRLMEVAADVMHTETWTRTPAGWKLRLTEEGEQTKLVIDNKPQPLR